MIRKEDIIKIGTFARPHGIKGELSLVVDFDPFEDVDNPYVICEMDGILVPFYVESFRYKSRTIMFVKLEDVDSITTAKEFVNREVFYPEKDVKKASTDDEPTWKFFTGYTLAGKKQGELGIIKYVDETTINTLFVVDYCGKELLVPMADDLFVSADFERQILVVLIPDGIFQLN